MNIDDVFIINIIFNSNINTLNNINSLPYRFSKVLNDKYTIIKLFEKWNVYCSDHNKLTFENFVNEYNHQYRRIMTPFSDQYHLLWALIDGDIKTVNNILQIYQPNLDVIFSNLDLVLDSIRKNSEMLIIINTHNTEKKINTIDDILSLCYLDYTNDSSIIEYLTKSNKYVNKILCKSPTIKMFNLIEPFITTDKLAELTIMDAMKFVDIKTVDFIYNKLLIAHPNILTLQFIDRLSEQCGKLSIELVNWCEYKFKNRIENKIIFFGAFRGNNISVLNYLVNKNESHIKEYFSKMLLLNDRNERITEFSLISLKWILLNNYYIYHNLTWLFDKRIHTFDLAVLDTIDDHIVSKTNDYMNILITKTNDIAQKWFKIKYNIIV